MCKVTKKRQMIETADSYREVRSDPGSEARRIARTNQLAHGIEGGLFIGALTFLSAETVLPVMIRSLNGPTWLIALMPLMMMMGLAWPSLFISRLVERLHRVKPFVLITGVFQRVPYVLAMLSLFMFGTSRPLLTLSLVALAPFLLGLTGGISFSAWQELTANVIPRERLASVWALRSTVGAGIGIGAGMTIRLVLARYPGTTGYGILHGLAAGLLMMSYAVFVGQV